MKTPTITADTSLTSTRLPDTAPDPALHRHTRDKLPTEPLRPNGWLWEEERQPDDGRVPILTVFLAGAECPFACVFCDLWRQTLDGPTPAGTIPDQIETVLADAGPLPAGAGVKLYNASNFFDPRAVPPCDDAAIADHACSFGTVIVESHPRFIGRRCFEFADRLDGTLEVAIGLETAEPDVLSRLNKQMTLDDFSRAAASLCAADIALRVFLLVPPPYLPETDVLASVQRSVTYAAEQGASHISLIPTRTDHPQVDGFYRHIVTPRLDLVEQALDQCLDTVGTVVTVDLWDIERLATCAHCRTARIDRLRGINLSGNLGGRPEARVHCPICMSSS